MSKASRQQAFNQEFRSHLDHHTFALTAALYEIITTPVPQVVKLLTFEMEADRRDFPVHVFAMDDTSPNQVYNEAPFCTPLLPEAGRLIPVGAIDQDSYEEDGVATFESGSRVMAEWFGECWHSAGGAEFPIPAYIHLQDDSNYYELRSRRWVRDTDIWR